MHRWTSIPISFDFQCDLVMEYSMKDVLSMLVFKYCYLFCRKLESFLHDLEKAQIYVLSPLYLKLFFIASFAFNLWRLKTRYFLLCIIHPSNKNNYRNTP